MKKYLFLLLCSLLAVPAMAQVKVTGTVTDENSEPVSFATVKIKNAQSGTTTDINGNFNITVPNDNATLQITYVGYEPYEVTVGSQRNLKIKLNPASDMLKEVVVVAFGTQKKINATGAVKTIGDEVLESRPITNAVQGLQGAISGLNITNDVGGELGAEMKINIRGVGSIGEGSSSSPLVLIDGMEGDLSTINPNDIENISVLKDGASASIYGSRAPFGVILVTTKKGRTGFNVNYTGNVRFQQPINVPNMVDGLTYALAVNDALINAGGSARFGTTQLDKIRAYMSGELPYGIEPREDDATSWGGFGAAFGNTDWYDVYLKDLTTSHEHNLSLSGANKGLNYYLSTNYMTQTGLFRYADEKYNRLTLNGKIGYQINKYVNVMWNTRYININNEKPSALNELFYHQLGKISPLGVVDLPNGEYHSDSHIPALAYGGRQSQKTRQLYNQLNVVVEPIKDWKLHFEINSRNERNPFTRDFNPIGVTQPNGKWQYQQILASGSDTKSINMNTGAFNASPAAGEVYHEYAKTKIDYFSTNVYTDYELTLKEKHHFKFLLGEQSEYFHRKINRDAYYYITSRTEQTAQNAVQWESVDEANDVKRMEVFKNGEWSSLGFFGRINYNYADRYMAEINMRADGASRFPKDQRWAFFPSVSVGWNIAEEPFWKPLYQAGFSYLKFRASYATLGNQNTTSFYPYYQQMNTNLGGSVIGGEQVTVLPMYSPFSASLTWETIENIGVGVDWGFFKNRLTGSFDWYQRKTKDMVGPANALSALYGASAPKTNNAELRTRGWELELAWRDKIGKDFSYGISATLSDYKTIITKYDSPDGNINGWYEGKNYGDLWGFRVKGIAKSDAEMFEHLATASQTALGNKWGGGDLMYYDLNGDGKVDRGSQTLDDPGDLSVIGNSTPRYAYSFTLEAQWKFIDVRAFFQGIGKRNYWFGDPGRGGSSIAFFGVVRPYHISLFYDHLDYFRYAGSELGANLDPYYGRLRAEQANNNMHISDRYLQDASYLRLKNLQVGLTLPRHTKLAKYVKKGRLYFSAENLLTWTKLRIFDPESLSNDTWGDGKTYPQYRTYSVGLELTF